eukprot:Hpha_TRINITY_DN9186_c0_g1::TRINITY_DN9186_c0_g1_i1::g.94530::m.94530
MRAAVLALCCVVGWSAAQQPIDDGTKNEVWDRTACKNSVGTVEITRIRASQCDLGGTKGSFTINVEMYGPGIQKHSVCFYTIDRDMDYYLPSNSFVLDVCDLTQVSVRVFAYSNTDQGKQCYRDFPVGEPCEWDEEIKDLPAADYFAKARGSQSVAMSYSAGQGDVMYNVDLTVKSTGYALNPTPAPAPLPPPTPGPPATPYPPSTPIEDGVMNVDWDNTACPTSYGTVEIYRIQAMDCDDSFSYNKGDYSIYVEIYGAGVKKRKACFYTRDADMDYYVPQGRWLVDICSAAAVTIKVSANEGDADAQCNGATQNGCIWDSTYDIDASVFAAAATGSMVQRKDTNNMYTIDFKVTVTGAGDPNAPTPNPGAGPVSTPTPGGGPAMTPVPGGGPAMTPVPGGGPAMTPVPGGGP